MVFTDSCWALSMNEQVLTTITSASSALGVSSAPARDSSPIMTSLSTRFLGQPRLTNPTLVGDAWDLVWGSSVSFKSDMQSFYSNSVGGRDRVDYAHPTPRRLEWAALLLGVLIAPGLLGRGKAISRFQLAAVGFCLVFRDRDFAVGPGQTEIGTYWINNRLGIYGGFNAQALGGGRQIEVQ